MQIIVVASPENVTKPEKFRKKNFKFKFEYVSAYLNKERVIQ